MIFRLARPLLAALDPETAHRATIRALKVGLYPRRRNDRNPALRIEVAGLDFPNPLGIAAGFDKDGEVAGALLGMGFGFAELGTVTPRAQAGNPRPRLFRLNEDQAVINRMGFNNKGHNALRRRLAARAGKPGLLGVNIGANAAAADRIADYCRGLETFYDVARYVAVNISSPNTPGLRNLQERGALEELMQALLATRAGLAERAGRSVPVFLKLSPDLSSAELDDVLDVALARGADGLILTNTTVRRDGLRSAQGSEAGGLSGRPLLAPSSGMLAHAWRATGGRIPLIGVGGIASARDAYAKIRAGASLVQLYTALVYQGPGLIGRILDGLGEALVRDGFGSIEEARGTCAQQAGPGRTRRNGT